MFKQDDGVTLKHNQLISYSMAPAPPMNIVDRLDIQFEAKVAPSLEHDEDDETGPRHQYYTSHKTLGSLYRAIDERKIWKNDIHGLFDRFGAILWDQLWVHVTNELKIKSLGAIKWRAAREEAISIQNA